MAAGESSNDAAERLAQAIRRYLYDSGEDPDPEHRFERHDGGCAVYDAYQHGPCDCGSEELLAAFNEYEASKAPY